MTKKCAIVLNGGGARASYQAGALRALYEIIKKDQNLFEIITGNSAGAINAVYLASNAEDWGASTQSLLDLWTRIKPEDVYDLSHYTMTKLGAKWMKGTFFRNAVENDVLNGLLNTEPLRKTIEREVDFKKIREHFLLGNINGLSLSTTNYFSGASVVFHDGDTSINEHSKPDRIMMRTEITSDHVMASSAIPLFFPPVKIGKSFYGDGCIRQITPLSPAVDLGAEKIIAIGVRYQQTLADQIEKTLRVNPSPQISQVAGIMMNAIFLDSLDADYARFSKINTIVEMMGPKSPWRYIPALMLKPSRDLGAMTEKLSKELPTMLRYFLRTIGVSGQNGMDLLSYLAFDSSYTEQIAELGYEDTMKEKHRILNFIDS